MTDPRRDILILGSGTRTGVPAIGCRCPVCTSTAPRNRRTRCRALVRRGEHSLQSDTAPDLDYPRDNALLPPGIERAYDGQRVLRNFD